MKISSYNTFVEKNGNIIGYNTMSNNFIAIPKQTYDVYKSFISNIYDLGKVNKKLYNNLKENGFIIPDERNELNELRLCNKEVSFNRHYNLTIIPTLDCNLKCWYCWEKHEPGSRMSKKIQQSIRNHILKEIEFNSFDSLEIEWFGGEPLLDFDKVVYPLCSSIKDITDRNGKVLSNTFITNGTLIDKEMILKLGELNSSFQITLDGDKIKHDKVRIKKSNNEGTYSKILESLYLITENIENARVTIRINFDDKTLKNIHNLFYDLKDIERGKVKVHLERVWQTKANPNSNKLLQETILLLTANNFEVDYGGFLRRYVTCKTDRYRQAGINYDGRVFKCTGRPFTDENCDGVLDESGLITWKRDRVSQRIGRSTFEFEMCKSCKMLPLCMGPCSQKCLENNWENMEKNCILKNFEMTIDEYIIFMFNNLYSVRQNQGRLKEFH
ncbi:MAG: radical SAM protein [Bacteroidetes bacterium]|nr:radical SAM protein [Bacteroidota bacterium]